MGQAPISDPSEKQQTNKPWDDAEAVDLWKYYGGIGGGDKNTMVQVCNLLLGFSVAIVAFVFGSEIKTEIICPKFAFSILASLGFIISLVSASVALTYGGYANWNWAKANQIARDYGWKVLSPDNLPWADEEIKHVVTLRAKLVHKLSAPTPTYPDLAPIFVIYFRLSLLSAAVHLTLLVAVWFNRLLTHT